MDPMSRKSHTTWLPTGIAFVAAVIVAGIIHSQNINIPFRVIPMDFPLAAVFVYCIFSLTAPRRKLSIFIQCFAFHFVLGIAMGMVFLLVKPHLNHSSAFQAAFLNNIPILILQILTVTVFRFTLIGKNSQEPAEEESEEIPLIQPDEAEALTVKVQPFTKKSTVQIKQDMISRIFPGSMEPSHTETPAPEESHDEMESSPEPIQTTVAEEEPTVIEATLTEEPGETPIPEESPEETESSPEPILTDEYKTEPIVFEEAETPHLEEPAEKSSVQLKPVENPLPEKGPDLTAKRASETRYQIKDGKLVKQILRVETPADGPDIEIPLPEIVKHLDWNSEPNPGEFLIEIPAEKLMDQIPEGNILPFDTPVTIRIPQKYILPQLEEGCVWVRGDWVVGQFPSKSLSHTVFEIVQSIPTGYIELPLSEIIPQIPPDFFWIREQRPVDKLPGEKWGDLFVEETHAPQN